MTKDKSFLVILQSYSDRNAENIKYYKFDKNWKRGEWVNCPAQATLVEESLAKAISYYWGVTYREIL